MWNTNASFYDLNIEHPNRSILQYLRTAMKSNFTLTLRNRISNIKPLPLLTSAVVALSVATVSPAFAQSTIPAAPTRRDQVHRQNKLNLTKEQQQQMERIRQSSREQMDKILTSEQKARLKTATERGENPRQVFASLNLTAKQRAKMQEVSRSSRQQIESILTPAQRQQQQHRRFQPQGSQTR